MRRLVPEGIVTGEDFNFSKVDVDHVGRNRVKEVAVVGNDDYQVFKIHQEVFQPDDGICVQVVGRFIENQDIRVTKKRLRQEHTNLLITRQVFHEGVVDVLRDAKTRKEGSGVGFGIPAIHLGKLGFQFGSTKAIRLCKIFFEVDLVLFFHDGIQFLVSHQDGF